MPELPEVQTTVKGLNGVLPGLSIKDVWTNYNSKYFYGGKTIKDPKYFKYFKEKIKGSKITSVNRRGKNILINLLNKETILIHMKMTGHLMYGNYNRKDPFNRHIRAIFYLSNGKTMELSDLRKFAKITLLKDDPLDKIGPEPLDKSFTYSLFKKQLGIYGKGKIKTILMDQRVMAGVGNIYSDESLWRAKIHPEEKVENIPEKELRELYNALKVTLKKGIDFGGDSMSDYRNIHGEKGKFQEEHKAYRKTGLECKRSGCKGKIVRIVVGGRSAHFCDIHQKKLSK